jgi:hypothetical protein
MPKTAKPKTANRDYRETTRRAAGNASGSSGPETIDHAARTVRAVIATDTPVPVFDWEAEEVVDEILLPAGMVEPPRMRLRVDHNSYRAADVIGRVTDFAIGRNEVEATLRFSRATDVETIWQRVAEGNLDSVSIGASYSMRDTVRIEPGGRRKIGGITYTAGERPALIVTRWTPSETSIVDTPADPRAVIRSASIGTRARGSAKLNDRAAVVGPTTGQPPSLEFETMPRKLKTRRNARTGSTARRGSAVATTARRAARRTVAATIPADDENELDLDDVGGIATAEADDDLEPVTRGRRASTRRGVAESTRTAATRRAAAVADDDIDDDDEADDIDGEDTVSRVERTLDRIERLARGVARDRGDESEDAVAVARREERARVGRIRELGEGMPARLVDRAINEGWTPEQFGLRALERMRRQSDRHQTRQVAGDGVNRAPAGHVRRQGTIEALQAGLLHRSGINLQNPAFATEAGRVILQRNHCGWLYEMNRGIEDRGNSDAERFAEDGRRYATDSAARTCERMLDMTTRNGSPGDLEEIVQRSFSSPVMPRVFGAIISVGMVEGYATYADSTIGWTSEADWADFRQNQPIGLDPTQGLRLHTRGTQAKDVDFADYGEAYSVARYTGKFILDDQDIIDDTVGANQMMPQQMGQMAARLRPDLVYAVLQTNANLSDGVALFAVGRGNALTSLPLSIDNLITAEAALATRVATSKSGRTFPLNMMAGFLVTPRALRARAKQIATSANIVTGNTTPQGERNPHDGEYQVRSDARLDTGVADPRTEVQTTGSAVTWYVAERSGQQTLQVGYRRGTGRAPQIRVRPLTAPGAFGIGWDIAHDIGVGVINARGIIRCVG